MEGAVLIRWNLYVLLCVKLLIVNLYKQTQKKPHAFEHR